VQGNLKNKESQNTTEKDNKIPSWKEGVDRFTNFVTKTKKEPSILLSAIGEILEEFKTKKWANTLTYLSYENNYLCKIVIDEYTECEVNIGVFIYEMDKCLVDIQELSGEHFTFAQFLENLKEALRLRDIIEAPIFTPQFMSNYGLEMDIGLELFD